MFPVWFLSPVPVTEWHPGKLMEYTGSSCNSQFIYNVVEREYTSGPLGDIQLPYATADKSKRR